MAHFGGSKMQTQGPPSNNLCEYCFQKPKFLPHDYCSKACGSRAKASKPTMCKQCGQKPVHKSHQFCGRNCANAWQATSGHINTGWNGPGQPQYGQWQQPWNPMSPPQMQYPPHVPTQPFQGFNQGSSLKGFVSGLKSLVSPTQQQPQQPQRSLPPQQQPLLGPPNPSYMQHAPGPIPPDPSMISPPITPMSSGMGGPTTPGSFGPMSPGTLTPASPGLNQQYYTPSTPTSPGIQDPIANGQTNGRHSSPPSLPVPRIPNPNPTPGQKSRNMVASPPSYSAAGTKPNEDPNPDPHVDSDRDPLMTSNYDIGRPVSIQAQTQFSIQVNSPPTGAGGHGNGNQDSSDPIDFLAQQSISTSPGPSAKCRLNECNKPVLVDPAANQPSEYCSQRHREDAMLFGQVKSCIMCLKMPRGLSDHFCSKACRERALSA